MNFDKVASIDNLRLVYYDYGGDTHTYSKPSCWFCRHSRLCGNSTWVGCNAVYEEAQQFKGPYKSYLISKEGLKDFYERKDIYIGYVDFFKSPNEKSYIGQFTENVVCFKPTDKCRWYEERK